MREGSEGEGEGVSACSSTKLCMQQLQAVTGSQLSIFLAFSLKVAMIVHACKKEERRRE